MCLQVFGVQCEVSTVHYHLMCHVIQINRQILYCSHKGNLLVLVHCVLSSLSNRRFQCTFMPPSADKLYVDADFLFHQDLVPPHSDKTTTKEFADQVIIVLDWPTNSTDLNPIICELKATVKAAWTSITAWHYRKLMATIPKNNNAAIYSKGALCIVCINEHALFRSLTLLITS